MFELTLSLDMDLTQPPKTNPPSAEQQAELEVLDESLWAMQSRFRHAVRTLNQDAAQMAGDEASHDKMARLKQQELELLRMTMQILVMQTRGMDAQFDGSAKARVEEALEMQRQNRLDTWFEQKYNISLDS